MKGVQDKGCQEHHVGCEAFCISVFKSLIVTLYSMHWQIDHQTTVDHYRWAERSQCGTISPGAQPPDYQNIYLNSCCIWKSRQHDLPYHRPSHLFWILGDNFNKLKLGLSGEGVEVLSGPSAAKTHPHNKCAYYRHTTAKFEPRLHMSVHGSDLLIMNL